MTGWTGSAPPKVGGSQTGEEVRRRGEPGPAPLALSSEVPGGRPGGAGPPVWWEAVPGPGPAWPLNIWCESKAFSSQEWNAAEQGLGTGLAGQTLP